MSTIRTRKNRQTGTMITVGRSDELGLNDGIGWALICEDHGTVMSMDTRKMADHHAPDPAGWCEVCAANVYGPERTDTMETMSEHCDTCHGTGDVPTGHTNHWGPVWGVCPECEGEGVVYICRACMDTGIDLAAPFNGENPPPCPACTASQHAA